VITESGVDISQSDEGSNTYCLWVEYDYTIENRTYDGSTLSYTKEGNCDSWSENADADYPPGKNVTVYVNPDNHEEAVLQPGLSGVDFFICCFFIFPLCGILLFGFCCTATYKSIMYPEKYIAGNIVPGDASTTRQPIDSDEEDYTRSSGTDLDGDGIADDLYGVKSNSIIDKIFGEVKQPSAILQSVVALLIINGFLFAAIMSERTYSDDFNVATEAMEGANEWPTTTAWFSENFTFRYSEETGEEYISGSIIIYCTQSAETWECGDNESGYERIEVPYRCTEYESVGPLQNPCDWAMKMFVTDSYHDSYSHSLEHWVVYVESEHCEWEGEPDDDNLWSCYYYNGETTEYDTWWQYCEHHLNESHWYCTDEFGEEASSPDNQNGTLYQPQEIETTVNYDPDDPTRIAFVEMLEWNTGGGGLALPFTLIIFIINVVVISRVAVPLIRKYQAKTPSD
jgi:hypothetical protein